MSSDFYEFWSAMSSAVENARENLPVRIREAIQPDMPFVYSSWLRQHSYSAFASGIPKATFFSNHRKIISKLVEKSDVYIACDPADMGIMYGFICGEQHEWPLLHYAFVKGRFRRYGIFKMLLGELGWTPDKEVVMSHFFCSKPIYIEGKQMMYNPYILHNIQIEVSQ